MRLPLLACVLLVATSAGAAELRWLGVAGFTLSAGETVIANPPGRRDGRRGSAWPDAGGVPADALR